jgi:hypothetical protein
MNIPQLIELTNNIANAPTKAEAQAFILDLQTQLYALQKENIELKTQLYEYKKQVTEYFEWEKTKMLYKPQKTNGESIVYVKVEQGDIREIFCANCFSAKRIIHLQPPLLHPDGRMMCPNCKNVFRTE